LGAQSIVEAINLTKVYNGTTVVDGLNLDIKEGEIYGFLGPNGAGKTTTILMLLGLTEPTSGTARICGFDSTREPLEVKRATGYIPEKIGYYEDLTAAHNLAYTARLNSISEAEVIDRVKESLDMVGLAKAAEQRVREFSRGMKQRLAIADILVKAPSVAILDEPTLGIDPKGVSQLLDLIGRVAKEQKMTIIMCSHQLHQVQRICNRAGILLKGKIVTEEALDKLEGKAFAGKRFTIEVQLSEVTKETIKAVGQLKGVVGVESSGDLMVVNCTEDLRPQIAKAVVAAEGSLIGMKVQTQDLEEIYLKYFTEG
jgi:ABC-2 type transport system ATP-binding protein